VAGSDRPDRDEILSQTLAAFATRSGALKWTQSRRFADFDTQIVDLIRARLGGGRAIEVLDVGVSDGRTSVELFQQLRSNGVAIGRYVASDYAPDVQILTDRAGGVSVVVDPRNGTPLQVIRPPFVFNLANSESPYLFPINRLLLRWLLATSVPGLLRRATQGDPSVERRTELLVHPDCLELMRREPSFTFEHLDIVQPVRGTYDVLRAMNVLNRSYFPADVLGRIFEHLHRTIRPDGLLVVGANTERGRQVNGTVYARRVDGFEALITSGEGSEAGAFVVAARGPASAAVERVQE
jgi:SAM-dependent methyltransferase